VSFDGEYKEPSSPHAPTQVSPWLFKMLIGLPTRIALIWGVDMAQRRRPASAVLIEVTL